MKIFILLFAFSSVSTLSSSVLHQKEPLCELVPNHIVMEEFNEATRAKNRYDNGYKEERYHEVLDAVITVFTPVINARGGTLRIKRDWSDGAVNAWASKTGQRYELEIPGGLARYHLISEQGFLTTICHELGHLLGGSPHTRTISFEGQSDYYSGMKCMEPMLEFLGYESTTSSELQNCYGEFCRDRLQGIKSLTSYYAELERRPPPTLETPSRERARRTLSAHPPSQCRFDTMVAGLLCDNREDFSYVDSETGSCQDDGQRPACWFVPEN